MRALVILLVLTLLCVASAAAEPLHAAGATASSARIQGDATLFQATDVSPMTSRHVDASVTLVAERMHVAVYEHHVVDALGVWIPDPTDDAPVRTYDDVDVQGTTIVAASFRLQAFGGAALDANASSVRFEAARDAYMDSRGIDERSPGETEVRDGAWFSQVHVKEPHVLADVSFVDLRMHGHFVLEASEVLFSFTGDGGQATVDTRSSTEGGLRTERLVRITLEKATLHFASDDKAVRTQWAGPSAWQVTAKELTLDDAVGDLQGRSLFHERVAIPGGVLVPTGGRLAVTPHADLAVPEDWVGGMNVMLGAAFLLVVPLGIAVGVRRIRVPTLDQIEDALEAAEYERAARLARRLARRRPELEGAWISRGIALTKAGQPLRAARELSAYLESHHPHDGVLHYVLATALMESGRGEAAQRAFDVAVARTPALGAQPVDGQAYS